jgi:ribokinase
VVIEALRLAKANRLTTILNPAPPVPLTSEELRLVDILTPNAREAQAMAGQQDLEEATRVLLAKGARCVIVTMGENGALLAHGRKMSQVPPFEVLVVDTTAAGDAFNGALACAVVEGEPLEKAVVFANAAGALATTKRGAQESLPTRREIEGLIHEQRRFS